MANHGKISRFNKYYSKIISSLGVINFVKIVWFFCFISFLKATYLFLMWYPVVFAGYNLLVKCFFEDNLAFINNENMDAQRLKPSLCIIALFVLGIILGSFLVKIIFVHPIYYYITALIALAFAGYYVTTVHE